MNLYNTGFGDSATSVVGFALHMFFMTMVGVAIVLLIIWMVKNLKAKQLLTWIIILMVAGLLGSLITLSSGLNSFGGMMRGLRGGNAYNLSDEQLKNSYPSMMRRFQQLQNETQLQPVSTQATTQATQSTQATTPKTQTGTPAKK